MGEKGPGFTEERFDAYEKSQTPVEIPEHILELQRKRNEEYNNPDLTRERWDELNAEHTRMMQGDSDDDLYYQLSVFRRMKDYPGEGIGLRQLEVERKIRERGEQK